MVKPEFTGKRDLSYNKWHRTIGDECYMIDIDCAEWRGNRGVVAIIERALDTCHYPRQELLEFKKFEIKVVSQIADALQVPAYLVFYDKELSQFDVYTIKNEQAYFWKAMKTVEYANFLKRL